MPLLFLNFSCMRVATHQKGLIGNNDDSNVISLHMTLFKRLLNCFVFIYCKLIFNTTSMILKTKQKICILTILLTTILGLFTQYMQAYYMSKEVLQIVYL